VAEFEIFRGYHPGSLGRVAELHGQYYHQHWNFGLYFEAKVATELAEFLEHYDPQRDGFWTAVQDGRVEGSIAIMGQNAHKDGAHLRWFIVSDALRGKGAGKRLIDTALDFCRGAGYKRVYLWTFEGLDAARYLYEKTGFRLAEQRKGSRWGKEVNEQRFALELG
jgi:GNAT superfamily N-acetyltransferase